MNQSKSLIKQYGAIFVLTLLFVLVLAWDVYNLYILKPLREVLIIKNLALLCVLFYRIYILFRDRKDNVESSKMQKFKQAWILFLVMLLCTVFNFGIANIVVQIFYEYAINPSWIFCIMVVLILEAFVITLLVNKKHMIWFPATVFFALYSVLQGYSVSGWDGLDVFVRMLIRLVIAFVIEYVITLYLNFFNSKTNGLQDIERKSNTEILENRKNNIQSECIILLGVLVAFFGVMGLDLYMLTLKQMEIGAFYFKNLVVIIILFLVLYRLSCKSKVSNPRFSGHTFSQIIIILSLVIGFYIINDTFMRELIYLLQGDVSGIVCLIETAIFVLFEIALIWRSAVKGVHLWFPVSFYLSMYGEFIYILGLGEYISQMVCFIIIVAECVITLWLNFRNIESQ